MYYVFTNIFWCLLAAALLGGLIGWLLRGFGFGSKLAELESDWGGRLGLLEGEKAQLATQFRESQTAAAEWQGRFTTLEADHGKLRSNFADVSGKVPVLEAAVAGWAAKSAAWDGEAAKLQADLKACADARGRLEGAVSEWASKAKAWDTERTDLVAKVRAAEERLGQALADDKADDAAYEKTIAALKADLAAVHDQHKDLSATYTGLQATYSGLQGNFSRVEGANRDLQGEVESSARTIAALRAEAAGMQAKLERAQEDDKADDAAYEKTIADLHGTIAKLEGETNDHKARIQRLIEADKANDAAYERKIGVFQSRIDTLEAESADLRGKLQRAVADDKADDAAYEETIADLRETIAAFEIERAEWTVRAQALETRLAPAPPLAMAAAAAAGGLGSTERSEPVVPEARYTELQDRFRNFVIRTQKSGWGDIERIEGIGPVYGQKLRSLGVAWVRELLEEGAGPEGRRRIAAESGIDPRLILTWVNHADLLRIEGVTPDWAELLEASGVDTVKELRGRVPENLQKKMEETNPRGAQGRYAPTVPDTDTVRSWVEAAKQLGPKVTH